MMGTLPQPWWGERLLHLPRRWGFAIIGLILGLGAPVGLAVVDSLTAGVLPHPEGVLAAFRQQPGVYIYVALSTVMALSLLGFLVGRDEETLEHRSDTDPLTGLSNRRYFELRLREALLQTRRYGTPLSLLMVDLDHLKPLNDRFGHAMGDHALITIARLLDGECRATDLPARIGGDEFVILAPGVRAEKAMELGERLRTALREQPNPTGESKPLTVSIGVADALEAGCPPGGEFIALADQALYEAKRQGRDRVVCASNELPESPVKSAYSARARPEARPVVRPPR